jgi:hypothetical protein
VGSGRGQLAGVAYEKLKDDLEVAIEKVAEAGVWDKIVDRVKLVGNSVLGYLNSDQFSGRAEEISKSMGNVFDALGESGLRLLQNLSGAKDLASTPDAIAKEIVGLSSTLADWARDLPGISSSIGRGLHTVVDDLSWMANALHAIIHPIDAAKQVVGQNSGDGEQARYEAIVARLNDMGLRGAVVDRMTVGRDPSKVDPWQSMMDGGFVGKDGRRYNAAGLPVAEGLRQVDTAGVQQGSQRLLAEKVFQALQGTDVSALQSIDEVKWHLRQQIPGFDDRLSQAQSETFVSGGYRLPPSLAAQVNGIGRDVLEPNYSTKFRGSDALIDEISKFDDNADKLGAVFRTADSKLRQLSKGEDGQDVFDRVTKWRDDSTAQVRGAMTGLNAEAARDPSHARDIADSTGALQDALNKLSAGYTGEVDSLAHDIVEKIGGYGVDISHSVKQAGDAYAAQVMQQFVAGQTGPQQQASALLSRHGFVADVGLATLPMTERQPFVDALLKYRTGALKNMGLPASDSLASMLSGQSSLASEHVAALHQALGLSQQNYASAQQAVTASPGDEGAQRALTQARTAVVEYTSELQRATMATNGLASAWVSFGDAAQHTVENGLAKSLTDVEMRTGSARAALSAMAREILQEFNQVAVHSIFGTIFGTPNGQPGMGNGIGGAVGAVGNGLMAGAMHLFGPTGPFAGYEPPPPVPVDEVPIGAVGAADGGMFRGGLRFFAHGGVVKGGPGQLAIIGEGGLGADEAVVPMRSGFLPIGHDEGGLHAVLPGGRRLPAAMFADGGVTGGGAGVATMGAASGWASPAASGGRGGGSDGGDTVTHVHVNLDGREIARHTFAHSKPLMKAQVIRAMGPGGDGRRAASRS